MGQNSGNKASNGTVKSLSLFAQMERDKFFLCSIANKKFQGDPTSTLISFYSKNPVATMMERSLCSMSQSNLKFAQINWHSLMSLAITQTKMLYLLCSTPQKLNLMAKWSLEMNIVETPLSFTIMMSKLGTRLMTMYQIVLLKKSLRVRILLELDLIRTTIKIQLSSVSFLRKTQKGSTKLLPV